MRFLSPHMEAEFRQRLHPEVREVLEDLDLWCEAAHTPQVVVTSVVRSEFDNDAAHGVARSWHLVAAAVDLRSRHYTPEQKKSVLWWLRSRCPQVGWEAFEHDAGGGLHIHLARKDVAWREAHGKGAQHGGDAQAAQDALPGGLKPHP